MHLTSPLLSQVPRIKHGFGSLSEPTPKLFSESELETLPTWTQVHGTRLAFVQTAKQDLGETDALWTTTPGLTIGVRHADCIPILLARKDGGAAVAIHAGWKGTLARIIEKNWAQLAQSGEAAKNWVAAIGPHIQPCCFEVGSDVKDLFASEFKELSATSLEPTPRHLDLGAIAESSLLNLGIAGVDRFPSGTCTRCAGTPQAPLFHSYRREKASSRQFSLIEILKSN